MIYLVALLFPWLAFMLRGNLGLGIICLVLQLTVIGWLPATIWAIIYISNQNAERRHSSMVATMKNQEIYNNPSDYLTMEEKARLFDERNR